MLIRWQKTIVDRRGNVQPGAVLTIRRMSDQAIVTIYRDGAGLDPYPTGTVTADENGYAYFYAAPGLYRITSTQPAIDWPDVSLSAPVVNVGGQTYESIADGLAATTDGEFFSVSPSIYPGGLFDVYRNDAGSAELVGTQPSLEAVDELRAKAEQSLLGPYADTTEGMGHAAEGQYFYVEKDSGDLDLYQNVEGVATLRGVYPDREALDALFDQVAPVLGAVQFSTDDGEIRFMNDKGLIAGRFKDDGTLQVAALETRTGVFDVAGVGDSQLDPKSCPPGFVWALVDLATQRIAGGWKDDGTLQVAALETKSLNGVPVVEFLSPVRAQVTRFDGGLVFVNNIGESLGEGSDGAITTSQEFNNVGFAARANTPTAYVPLTVANTQWGARGESPMYGACGHVQGLIAAENGEQNYQLLACNNAVSGRIIAEISKGSSWYANELTQIQAGKDIAQSEGRTSVCSANLLTIGTNDVTQGTARSAYAAQLRALHRDLAADATAITGQGVAPVTIMSQTSHATNITSRDVQLAQVDVALDTVGVYLATPLYFFDYYDTLHIVAESSKWLGGYYGLVYKRVVIDGGGWDFLRPVRHFRQGRVVELSFNTVSPLVLDTVAMPAQVNSGFSIVDADGDDVAISSVSVKDTGSVQITCASAIPAGSKVRYGWNRVTGKGTFNGGGGNLRDSLGDTETYTFDIAGTPTTKRLDRWCVIFEYQL